MQPELERQQWPDAEGGLVSVGDWIEVWCSWTGESKFEGRPVQIVAALTGQTQVVFRLHDPSLTTQHYMPAHLGSFRRVKAPARKSGIFTRAEAQQRPSSIPPAKRMPRCVR